jgi:O-methyltransferase
LTHALFGSTAALVERPAGPRKALKQRAFDHLERRGIRLVRLQEVTDEAPRAEGRDWPLFGQTMVGLKRLANVRACVEDVLAREIPGDLIETGVWRGGASIFMRGVLKAHGVTDRRVFVADSFEGMPFPTGRYAADAGSMAYKESQVAVSLEEVQENFRRYGLLDAQVVFAKGWFRDTLPALRDERWAVVRLDGDMYESTMDALENLYPGLATGGYLIVDDYSLAYCRAAVHDFRTAYGIDDPIRTIDWTGVFWQKTG